MKYPSKNLLLKDSVTGSASERAAGDTAPRKVIRGESNTLSQNNRLSHKLSIIDYLAFTIRPNFEFSAVFPLKDELINIFNVPDFGWVQRSVGWNGYAYRIDLDCFGLLAYGGLSQNETIHVRFGGKGCANVKDWTLVHDWLQTTEAKISRLDIAHDDFTGSSINIAKAIEWEQAGLYASGGRNPKTHLRDDRDSGDGKTFEIGVRKSGKFGRIYEKGRELGDPKSDWCRAEIEFKSADRIIPYEAILLADQYLSGAYPAFKFLNRIQSRIETIRNEQSISLESAIEWCRIACGQYINILCLLNDEDCDSVIRTLRRPGLPDRLEPQFKKDLIEAGTTI